MWDLVGHGFIPCHWESNLLILHWQARIAKLIGAIEYASKAVPTKSRNAFVLRLRPMLQLETAETPPKWRALRTTRASRASRCRGTVALLWPDSGCFQAAASVYDAAGAKRVCGRVHIVLVGHPLTHYAYCGSMFPVHPGTQGKYSQ
jgi:hypothetical protein